MSLHDMLILLSHSVVSSRRFARPKGLMAAKLMNTPHSRRKRAELTCSLDMNALALWPRVTTGNWSISEPPLDQLSRGGELHFELTRDCIEDDLISISSRSTPLI